MNHKDYSEPYKILTEAFIDVAFSLSESDQYSDIISMWEYDFGSIIKKIPLNDEGVFEGLALHYHVDEPWKDCENEPWEVDNIEISSLQLLFVKDVLEKEKKSLLLEDETFRLYQICSDMCDIFSRAENGKGRIYIKYYY